MSQQNSTSAQTFSSAHSTQSSTGSFHTAVTHQTVSDNEQSQFYSQSESYTLPTRSFARPVYRIARTIRDTPSTLATKLALPQPNTISQPNPLAYTQQSSFTIRDEPLPLTDHPNLQHLGFFQPHIQHPDFDQLNAVESVEPALSDFEQPDTVDPAEPAPKRRRLAAESESEAHSSWSEPAPRRRA